MAYYVTKQNSVNPNINILPVSTSKEIGDFSDLKVGTGTIFISAISEKLPTPDYNDLVMVVWQLNELSNTGKHF